MSNLIENPRPNSRGRSKLNPEQLPDTHGKITTTIGTGEVAKDSIIYLVIRWSFISGTVITTLLIINNWLFRQNEKVPDLTNDIKVTWSIIIPIITLALGYAFGKSKK
ncbi:hypothetical protein [uncultured Flavobacterium sp.]|uniref:hypothetical protein n=1 Tax=uncultured Flavobacterium sp. TaxID=165435 RepID=UPI0025E5BF88|nr:hypothetical protein [uncultured Flavobacterium sp.]